MIVAEALIFGAGTWEDRDEFAAILRDVGKVLPCCQLAVCHVDEVSAAQNLPQLVHVASVDCVVRPVAAVHVMGDRHSPVCGDVEFEDQLLQVWPVVLRVMWRAT